MVCLIPEGRVTSYGAIARYLGSTGGARMVGWALMRLPQVPVEVPAQRVVNRNGLLSGKQHFGPGNEMAELLEAEGITVTHNTVQNFKNLFWDPALELNP